MIDETTTREKIFKRIRNALIEKAPNPYPNLEFESSVYQPVKDSLDITFAQEFTKVAGKFIYCEDDNDMVKKLKHLIIQQKYNDVFCLEESLHPLLDEQGIIYHSQPEETLKARIGITLCEFLIAKLGSIMVSSRQFSGRRMNAFPEIHIVIARTSQLVPDLKEAFTRLKEKYMPGFPSLVSLITGPSRTADIEKTLVMGAHGPKELFVFLVEDN